MNRGLHDWPTHTSHYRALLSAWLQRFLPGRLPVSSREILLGSLGAGFGVLLAAGISQITWGGPEPWFIAPMGAVAILLFALPSSQLAQPWPTLAGNLLAALAGVICARYLEPLWLAAAAAVALSLLLMFLLHCLHPPAGSVALLAIFGDEPIRQLGYGYAVWPVLANVVLLLLTALVFNTVAGREYPNRQRPAPNPHQTKDAPTTERLGPNVDDLESSLEAHAQLLDISLGDLQKIVQAAEARAHQRHLGQICCRDVMSRDVVSVTEHATLLEAWTLMRQHRFQGLPVLRGDGTFVGILTLTDLVDLALGSGPNESTQWATMLSQSELIRRDAQTAAIDQPIAELVPLLSGGLHQLPVIDATDRVVGILSQSDLVAALFKQGLRSQ